MGAVLKRPTAYGLLFALLPWSVEWPLRLGNAHVLLPAEPLIACLALLTAWHWRREQWQMLRERPVWALPLVWMGWQVLSAVASSDPQVSWKYVLVEGAHLWAFYLAALRWPDEWPRLLRIFGVSMLGVVAWTLGRHWLLFEGRDDQALLAPMPFFYDHNIFAAVLGLAGFGALALTPEGHRRWAWGYLAVVAVATVLSTSRAAFLALVVAFGVKILTKTPLRLRRWVWVGTALVVLIFGVGLWQQRAFLQEKINRDVSLQERLNRYDCAWRMALERPLTGWGPGTFQQAYLPHQRPERMTRISVTQPIVERSPSNYGRGGGAHSEYLQVVAETGWPGLGLWLVVWIGAFFAHNQRSRPQLWLLLGLLTWLLHGIFNNFLHDARVAALVWGLLALRFRLPEKSADTV